MGNAFGQALKKIVFLPDIHPADHPAGAHDYPVSLQIIKDSLDKWMPGVKTEIYSNGWPTDESTLDDASTIISFTSGADRDTAQDPLFTGNRRAVLQKQMDRGCGLMVFHWGLWVPKATVGAQFLNWVGGFFDYQGGPNNGWYSNVSYATATLNPVAPTHPISSGLKSFPLVDEYYFQIRFEPTDTRVTPIISAVIPGVAQPQTVGWSIQRTDAGQGRGFGYTGGHLTEDWLNPNFRTMVLNAILWTGKMEVPAGGLKGKQVVTTMKRPTQEATSRLRTQGWLVYLDAMEAKAIRILDISGKVKQILPTGHGSSFLFPHSLYRPGIYVMSVGEGASQQVHKVVLN